MQTKGNIKMMKQKKTWESVQSCVTGLPAVNRLQLWTYKDTTTDEIIFSLERAQSQTILSTKSFENMEKFVEFVERITQDDDFFYNQAQVTYDLIESFEYKGRHQ